MTSRWWIARRVVQTATLGLIAAPLAGWHHFSGNLAAAELFGIPLADPLACIQALVGGRVWVPGFLGSALLVSAGYFLLGGRSFCGWVCPVGLLCELGDKLRRRLAGMGRVHAGKTHADKTQVGSAQAGKRLPLAASRCSLALVLLTVALTGIPLFEVLSPIGIVSRAIAFTALVPLLVPGAILLVEIAVAPRVWCRSLCPLGGYYALLARCSPLKVAFVEERCTGCNDCRTACPVPEVLEPSLERGVPQVSAGDCSRCLACLDSCPARALRLGWPW